MKQKFSPGILSVEWLLKSQGSLSLAEGRHSLSGCKCTVVHRVKRNNLEIVMIKAEFGLLTASVPSEEILICEKPKITSEILAGGGGGGGWREWVQFLSYHGTMLP